MAGFWDFLRNVGTAPVESSNVSYAWFEPRVEYLTGPEWAEEVASIWAGVRSMTPAEMYKSQPHLRTVVGFVARNVAQLGLHTYERVSETDRRRDRDNGFARALASPDPVSKMTRYRLLYALTVDKMLYDRAYWVPFKDADGEPRLRRIPPGWLTPNKKGPFGIETYWLSLPNARKEIPANRLIEFGGYSATSITGCSPAIESLKETLGEQIEASKYRAQVWKRGGRTSSVITRPVDAPKWSDKAAERFREDWYAQYTGDGPRAGGTPILEDGMSIQTIDFSALDMQWAEGQTLAFSTVASAFHVNPTMVGILQNANYSNVREFRRMLYGDTLGPYLADFEDVINGYALPYFDVDPATTYAEFNIGEKLQGSFEEQATVLTSAVGAPWMLRDEARAKMNMPALGGDAEELVVPLNVLVGGQASPRDSGTQNEDPSAEPEERSRRQIGAKAAGSRLAVKVRAPETYEEKVREVVAAFFDRQARVVSAALGAKAADEWWDDERWDRELGDDLYRLSVLVSEQVGTETVKAIGFEPDAYDTERTLAWLKEVASRSATELNATTKAKLDAALEASEELSTVWESNQTKAAVVAVSTVTLLSGFAMLEAAKQTLGEEGGTKTWITGSNPRPKHAAMDGQTVALSDNFSIGAAWPGDGSSLGAEDLANCNCQLQINVP